MRLENLELDPELLWIVVFGPGFGESIVVHVPGAHWLAVDSLRLQDRQTDVNPAADLLDSHGAELSLVALTHAHLDHVVGLTELLDRRVNGSPVGMVEWYPPQEVHWERSKDASKVRDNGAASAALNRIDEIWRTEPQSVWKMRAGAIKNVGPLQLEVLFPKDRPTKRPVDLNKISTPMLLRWEACQILLGADLPNTCWNKVEKLSDRTDLKSAHLLKAPHHGSKSAQHHLAIGSPPPESRPCLVTPFNRGTRLPSYEDGAGIDQLLRTHEEVTLTNAPAPARGKSTPRRRLVPKRGGFGPLNLEYEQRAASPRIAWVGCGFDAEGREVERKTGDAAGVVVSK